MDCKCTCKFYDYLPKEAKEIRQAVFVEEQGFHNEFDDIDDRAFHFLLIFEGKYVATARIFADEEKDTYDIGRVCVLKPYRKYHLGKNLMQFIETKVKQLGGKKIVLSAQCRVRSFYEKLGYVASGDIYLDEYCEHIHMEKII